MTAAALAFTEGNSATVVDAGLTVTDADSANLASAAVSIAANFVTGEDVLGFTTQNGITGSFNATTGVLTLTGSATVAHYETALRSVTYANASTNPSMAARTVSVVVNDGTANSNTATRAITVAAVNNPPVVTMTASALAFTEGNSATVVDAGLTVTDADSANLASATVAIAANFVSGEDVLGFTTQNGITGSFNATTGVLTLSGSATVAQLPDSAALGDLRQREHQPVDGGADGVGGGQRRHGQLQHRDPHHHGGGDEQPAGRDDDGVGAGVHGRQQRDGRRCRPDGHGCRQREPGERDRRDCGELRDRGGRPRLHHAERDHRQLQRDDGRPDPDGLSARWRTTRRRCAR